MRWWKLSWGSSVEYTSKVSLDRTNPFRKKNKKKKNKQRKKEKKRPRSNGNLFLFFFYFFFQRCQEEREATVAESANLDHASVDKKKKMKKMCTWSWSMLASTTPSRIALATRNSASSALSSCRPTVRLFFLHSCPFAWFSLCITWSLVAISRREMRE